MAGDNNLDLALRMKADNSQAKSALREVKKEIEDVEQASTKANTSQVQTAKAVVDGHKAAADATKKEAEALGQTGQAADKTSAAADKLGNSLGKVAGHLATGNVAGAAREVQNLGVSATQATAAAGALGVSVGALVVMVGALAVAAYKGQKQTDEFTRALISTGAAAQATAGQLNDVVNRVGDSTGRYGDADKALLSLAQTGQYTRAQLEQLTQTAVEFATMTGGPVADGVKFVDGIMSGNLDTLVKLDQQYHFLSSTQLDQIQNLRNQGEEERATAIAQKAASDAVHTRAEEVKASVGIMERAWTAAKEAAAGFWNAAKGVGAEQSLATQLKNAQDLLAGLQASHMNSAQQWVANGSPEDIAAAQAKIADIQRQMVAEGFKQTQAAVDQWGEDASKAASLRLDTFKTPAEVYLQAQKQAEKDLHDYLLGHHSDADIAAARVHAQEELDRAKKTFEAATRTRTGNIDGAQLNADISAAQLVVRQIQDVYANGQKALDAQHKAGLVSDAAYYDAQRGMLAVWEDDKAAALEQEKVAAQSHLKTQADRIKADQKVAEIDQQITQVHAEASVKRQQIDANEQQAIKQTEAAWEKFRASIGSPLQIQTDKVKAQVAELDAFLAKGKGADEYEQNFGRILDGAGGRGPRGAGSLMAGDPFAAQIAAIKAHYAEQEDIQTAALRKSMSDNQKNFAAQLAAQRAYNTASEQLAHDKAGAIAAIQRQEAQYALSAAEQGFGALAQVYANAYGAQSRQAQIAFALQKASALANAILAIQESVANSGKLGFPWNIISIAGAIAQGAAVLATIRSTNLNVGGGFSGGGWTGPGDKYQPAGIVHAGEVVWSQADVARAGGVGTVETMRLRGYADGGVVSPFAGAPNPSALGFNAPSAPAVNTGRLVVAVSPVTVILHSSGSGDDVQSKQSTDGNGGQVLELFLGAVAKDISNGGNTAKAMDRRWLLKRKGNSYG